MIRFYLNTKPLRLKLSIWLPLNYLKLILRSLKQAVSEGLIIFLLQHQLFDHSTQAIVQTSLSYIYFHIFFTIYSFLLCTTCFWLFCSIFFIFCDFQIICLLFIIVLPIMLSNAYSWLSDNYSWLICTIYFLLPIPDFCN
jgi:hypothetical protein